MFVLFYFAVGVSVATLVGTCAFGGAAENVVQSCIIMAIFAKAIFTVRTPPIMALIHQELVAILATRVRLHFFLTRV